MPPIFTPKPKHTKKKRMPGHKNHASNTPSASSQSMKRPLPTEPVTDAQNLPAETRKTTLSSPHQDVRLTPCYLPLTLFHSHDLDQRLLAQRFPTLPSFSVDTLAAGIAQGCSRQAIQLYMSSWPKSKLVVGLQQLVKGRHPVIFYAAERNSVECVRLLLEAGVDANVHDVYGVPLLAFAIMRSKWTVQNQTEVVKILLAFGASPRVIPFDMWTMYMEPPSAVPDDIDNAELDPAKIWCGQSYRKILAETLNLSIRYFLNKASQIPETKQRGMQIAKACDYTALLQVPYLLVGQTYACLKVVKTITSHVAMNINEPLVLVFAGPSGHGKTELAKQLGSLLQAPMSVIDCAQMTCDTALFGARNGYEKSANGSQLNNFLADNSGKRTVVFLDEFDKTKKEVHNSLLLVLGEGLYHDRRDNMAVDARKVIWILASNLGDHEITTFYDDRLKGLSELEKMKAPHKVLENQLKARFRNAFGAPIAGRMKDIAPFYPFNEGEQAVVVHKFMLQLADELRRPIATSGPFERYPGHINLAIESDGRLCKYIADESFIPELGARSLTSGIDELRRELFGVFVDTDELVEESMNEGPLMRFSVQLKPVSHDTNEIVVAHTGFTNYYRGQSSGIPTPPDDETDGDEVVDDLSGRLAGMMNGAKSEDGEEDL